MLLLSPFHPSYTPRKHWLGAALVRALRPI